MPMHAPNSSINPPWHLTSTAIFYKFRFDRADLADFLNAAMENAPYQKLLSKGHIAFGVIATLGVFVMMSILLRPFTFSPDPSFAQLQACFTAIPISATFWFAINMFMIVLVDQRNKRKES